ncbi:MAG: DUF1127 domain-containing protein [Pseudomonadota bacterium]
MPTLRLARPLAALRLSGLPFRIARLATLARTRMGLARLDDHLLRDIGVTRDQAVAEASRTPWDAPSHWKG